MNNTIIIFFVFLIMSSCTSYQNCPDKLLEGNLGEMINSDYDDIVPYSSNSKFLFINYLDNNSKKQLIKVSTYSNNEFLLADESEFNFLTEKYVINSLYVHTNKTGKKEIYFSGYLKNDKKKNSNIFYFYYDENKWSNPELINNINTEYFEAFPYIFNNDSCMIFVSDIPNGFGETDLYLSIKQENNWNKPINLGNEINTKLKELYPVLSKNGVLYYSSNGFKNNNGLDIIRAKHKEGFIWSNPIPLEYPINTSFDEISPYIDSNNIYISSKRIGGCGGYDLYKFNNCGDVIVSVLINPLRTNINLEGFIGIYNKNNELLNKYPIENNGTTNFSITPLDTYIIQYHNNCNPKIDMAQQFFAPCSDSSTIKIDLIFNIMQENINFYFNEYNVPFFVTGYYLPNTKENLDGLRMKFNHGLIGNSDTTKYIENPGIEYDEYALIVEKAFNDAILFLIQSITDFNNKCYNQDNYLNIIVHGYSDPRQISFTSKYDGININDSDLNFIINRGDSINNIVLSKLRAYYTAKYLQNILEINKEYLLKKNSIKWTIDGMGIDESNFVSNELKRRISIEVKIQNK